MAEWVVTLAVMFPTRSGTQTSLSRSTETVQSVLRFTKVCTVKYFRVQHNVLCKAYCITTVCSLQHIEVHYSVQCWLDCSVKGPLVRCVRRHEVQYIVVLCVKRILVQCTLVSGGVEGRRCKTLLPRPSRRGLMTPDTAG